MSQFLSSAFFLPVAPWPAAWSAADAEQGSKQPSLNTTQQCSHPASRVALAGFSHRLYVPRTYWMFLVGLIGAYLGAIFSMDSIACENTDVCKNYSKLEWAFSQSAAIEVLDAWTAKGRAAMALSAGLHIFSSFLFAQLFIVGGTALREFYACRGRARLSAAAGVVPFLGRVFNALYCTVHCLNAATIVGGNPSKALPVVVGVLLVAALALLIVCALSIIGGGAYALALACAGARRAAAVRGDAALTAQSPHDSAAPVTVTMVAVPSGR